MAASFVVVEENAMPVMLALRLKVADKKITEVETIIARSRNGTVSENLTTPRPAMSLVPDASQRNSRADLISSNSRENSTSIHRLLELDANDTLPPESHCLSLTFTTAR